MLGVWASSIGAFAIAVVVGTNAAAQEKCYFLECTPPQQPIPTPSPPTSPSPPVLQGFVISEGIDFWGDDIVWLTEYSLATCGEACRANSACKAFTFNTETRVCIVKHGLGQRVSFPVAISGVLQRVATSPVQARIEVKEGIDYEGGDYIDVRYVSFDECKTKCSNDQKCAGFSYVLSKNWCWLKHTVTKPHRNRGVISGAKY